MSRQLSRVVHVSSAHPANDPRIHDKECSTLLEAGYDVEIIATGIRPAGTPIPVTITWRPTSRAIRVTAGAAVAILYALCRRPVLVHLHDPELAPFLPLLRICGIIAVFDSHEDIPAALRDKQYLSVAKRKVAGRFGVRLVRYIDRWCDGVVAATPSIARAFSSNKTCLVQNYPITSQWQTSTGFSERQHLVYIGGLSEARGAWHMLDAMQVLRRTCPDLRLKIAGNVSAQLLRDLQGHPSWESIDYLGVLTREEVSALLGNSMIGLVLFQSAHNHVESQPTKLFEYMAAGLPVVASDFEHWRKLVDLPQAGLTVEPQDAAAVAGAVCQLVRDRKAAEDMGRRGQQMSESVQNWNTQGANLVRLYDSLIGQKQNSESTFADR